MRLRRFALGWLHRERDYAELTRLVILVFWTAAFADPGRSLADLVAFDALAAMAPDVVWAGVVGGISGAHLLGLRLRNLFIRAGASLVQMAFWAFLTTVTFWTDAWTVATPVWGAIAAGSAITFVRLYIDAWDAVA